MLYDLDKLDIKKLGTDDNGRVIKFLYLGEIYYFKRARSVDYYYNEVLAYKIGTSLNYDMTPYSFACYQDSIGCVSKSFMRSTYTNMDTILKKVYNSNINKRNNLNDIRNAFIELFPEKVDELFQRVIDIFLFDVLIGNSDRHTENYGLYVSLEDVSFVPLFDHENMLDDRAIYDGEYCLGIDSNDYYNWQENLFYKFLEKYGDQYKDRIMEMLKAISEDNLLQLFTGFEEETIVEKSIMEKVLRRFSINETMIRRGL